MKEVIIGKNGDQPFTIDNDCVSRRHARITIDDDGKWVLEDLGSSNGTYMQEENGEYVQVNKAAINEYTRIALGATTAKGCIFYAHHVLEEKGSYAEEMRYVISLYESIQEEKQQLEAATKKQTQLKQFLPPAISAIIMGVILFVFPQYRMFMAASGVITTVLATLLGAYMAKNSEAMKAIAEKQGKLVRCPKCNRQLTVSEIQDERCLGCKTHT